MISAEGQRQVTAVAGEQDAPATRPSRPPGSDEAASSNGRPAASQPAPARPARGRRISRGTGPVVPPLMSMTTFDELIGEASAAPFTGWDFSWLDERTSRRTRLPWSYNAEVAARAGLAASMLDLGTGGGEWLARFPARPRLTVATEAYEPNVRVAADRLRPHGVPVIWYEAAPENERQADTRITTAGVLPFGDDTMDLVISRHESFSAQEVFRVLKRGGTFVTQQVDRGTFDDLYRLLGLAPPPGPASWMRVAARQLAGAGFVVTVSRTGELVRQFPDVAAVAYYLKAVAWAIPGHSPGELRSRLRAAHETENLWPYPVRHRRFLIVAAKPDGRGLRIGAPGLAP